METKEKQTRKAKAKPEAVKHAVVDTSGKEVGSVELAGEVFAAKVKPSIVHAVVRWQLAKRRAGTHSTLTRTMMIGGQKKPFKQKGTGSARAGSSVSPLWVGGAVVHGPHPRSYEHALPRKVKRQALCAVLSSKVKEGKLVVLDSFELKAGKTSEMKKVLGKLGLGGKKTLLLSAGTASDVSIERAGRNLARLSILAVQGLNVYDLMCHDYVIGTKEVLSTLQKSLAA